MNECKLILETFQNNKVPGNNGIPVESCKKLWPFISEPFIKCVNECFENKDLSSSQKQAVITLIEKRKDCTLLENRWPIFLLNVDTKIMSKVIASRLKMFYLISSTVIKLVSSKIATLVKRYS